ncbi:hypothetical protein HPB51_007310 [Rhipicephalus microplus]|uniref:Uncharacterized protein n=1 Tax=Rhipicephalus microplus TaxID=6941 RepID=A0A9J6EZK6_RHIMP|nr:hypothetical protein HPB51_007310 [Rhipicephalus microplus]
MIAATFVHQITTAESIKAKPEASQGVRPSPPRHGEIKEVRERRSLKDSYLAGLCTRRRLEQAPPHDVATRALCAFLLLTPKTIFPSEILGSSGPARTIDSWRPIQSTRKIQNQRQLQELFHVQIASRIPFEIRGPLHVQDTVSIQGWHQTSTRSGSGLGSGQGKTDGPSIRPDPSPRTDCGHARELQLSGVVPATEDQSRGKPNLTWADRVRSNDGEQPMQCDLSPEHARDAEILRLKKENADLKDTLTKMANEMAKFKRMLSTMHSKTEYETTDTPVPAPIGDGLMATKRRAVVSKLKNTESQVEEIRQTLVTITESIKMVAGSVASLTESAR